MRTTQAVEVEADLSLEVWNQQWLVQGNDVVCRMCDGRQRLVCAHEVFAHRRPCMWHVLQKKHYPWQALASILRPFDWEH